MVVVFQILEGSFRDPIIIVLNFFRITEEPEEKTQLGQLVNISGCSIGQLIGISGYSTGCIQGFVLPGTVAVGFIQDIYRFLKRSAHWMRFIEPSLKNRCQLSEEPSFALISW